jgi:antitoxin FitA
VRGGGSRHAQIHTWIKQCPRSRNRSKDKRRAIAVASITIELSDSQFQTLQDLAVMYGITPEVLLKISLEDWLNSLKSEFVDTANYVLTKNAELYQRLA